MSDSDADLDDDVLAAAVDDADRHLEATKPRQEHLQCLKTTFGHNAFRPMQWEIIRAIIEDRRDVCVVMPTGYGKSLCFQFPSVFTNGITLVVSPLISLMQDQVLSLEVANIPACFLGSAQRNRNIEADVLNGDFRLVYVSPEYITGDRGKDLLRQLEKSITLIAIDEAHCVSQWGHDFRHQYRQLSQIRDVVKKVPILAVTATATPQVRSDIAQSLRMQNTRFICMGFDRPNIEFSFRPKSDNSWDDLRPYVTNIRGSVIVYVLRKADAEQVAKVLRDHGVRCEYYHAGAALKKRQEVLEDFTRDRLQVIVATVAFGMGIDKPDVRLVLHYGVSKNLETYYQEVGRAGRDGEPSKAVTFFDKKDFSFHQWLLTENHERKSEEVQNHLQELAQKMKEFCYTTRCRRAFILEYFGGTSSHLEPRSNCCDNCKRGASAVKLSDTYQGMDDAGNYDFTDSARLFLSAMKLTTKASTAVGVLKGSMARDSEKYKNHKLFGAGKLWPKGYWEAIQSQLRNDKMLTLKPLPAPYRPIIAISPLGLNWLSAESAERLMFKAIPEMYAFIPKKRKVVQITNNNNIPSTSSAAVAPPVSRATEAVVMSDKNLESILLSIRGALAEHAHCGPFVVASDPAIKQMVAKKPVHVKEFKAALIDGFSVAKIEKFAAAFVEGISLFMQNEFCIDKIMKRCPLKSGKSMFSSEMQKRFRDMIDSKMSLSKIAESNGLTLDTACAEIVIILRSGYSITKSHLAHLVDVDDGIFQHIKSLAEPGDFHCLDAIDRIKEKFCTNTRITEHMLVLVLNYLKVRRHLKVLNVAYFDPDEDKLMNVECLVGKYANQIALNTTITASQIATTSASQSQSNAAAMDVSMEDDEFTDDMIDKIFVEWSPEETEENSPPTENAPNKSERMENVAPHVQPSTSSFASNQQANESGCELVHDIPDEEQPIDDEMIDSIFDDWSQEDKVAAKHTTIGDELEQPSTSKNACTSTDALQVHFTNQEIMKSSTDNVIESTQTTTPPIVTKKPTVPRVFVRQKAKIEYCSDSDSEEENQPKPEKPQRSLPSWMPRPPSKESKKDGTSAKRIKKVTF